MVDLTAGRLQFMADSGLLPLARAGKIRLIGIFENNRTVEGFPQLKTFGREAKTEIDRLRTALPETRDQAQKLERRTALAPSQSLAGEHFRSGPTAIRHRMSPSRRTFLRCN